jgi:hypothetical protein
MLRMKNIFIKLKSWFTVGDRDNTKSATYTNRYEMIKVMIYELDRHSVWFNDEGRLIKFKSFLDNGGVLNIERYPSERYPTNNKHDLMNAYNFLLSLCNSSDSFVVKEEHKKHIKILKDSWSYLPLCNGVPDVL